MKNSGPGACTQAAVPREKKFKAQSRRGSVQFMTVTKQTTKQSSGFSGITSIVAYATAISLSLTIAGFSTAPSMAAPKAGAKKEAAPAKDAKDTKDKSGADAKDKDDKKAEAPTTPEPPLENVISVTTQQLVDKPSEYLKKNIKFSANFHAFSSLALDYKPALRPAKTHLSFLVLRPNSKVPFSEIKLAMPIPKDKDPKNTMLQNLKEGDTVEVTGTVFAAALDEPWVDVKQLVKTASAPDKNKDKDKTAEKKDDKKDDKKEETK